MVPLMTSLLVLFANHPHLMHLGGAAALLVLFAAMQDEIASPRTVPALVQMVPGGMQNPRAFFNTSLHPISGSWLFKSLVGHPKARYSAKYSNFFVLRGFWE